MTSDVSLPNMQEPVFPGGKPPTTAYRKFFERLSRLTGTSAEFQTEIAAILLRLDELETGGGDVPAYIDGIGIQIVANDDTVRISLSAYLADLLDVSEALPADRDRLTWNATTAEWEPAVILNPDLSAADTDGLAEGATNKYFHDAPSDGTPYVRQDAGWVAAASTDFPAVMARISLGF